MAASDQPSLFGNNLDSRLERHFRPLCTTVDKEEQTSLTDAIVEHVVEIEEARRHNEFLDIRTAQNLAQALLLLLKDFYSYPEPHRALIVGAARYFIQPHDADPDIGSVLGLDDDVVVLNYVLDTIGKPELKVQL